jgi:hypothetical protein
MAPRARAGHRCTGVQGSCGQRAMKKARPGEGGGPRKGIGATQTQFVQTFATARIRVIFLHEVETTP